MDYVAVSEPLRLGCYRSNVGETGRFAKGLMNDCKIYNYALEHDFRFLSYGDSSLLIP